MAFTGGDAAPRRRPGDGNGGRTGGGGAIAKLAIRVGSPAIAGTGRCDRACMEGPCRDAGEGVGPADRNRGAAVEQRGVTQLPAGVLAPAVGGAGTGQRAGVVVATGKGTPTRIGTDRDRYSAPRPRAVAYLAIGVVAPALGQRARLGHEDRPTRMATAGREGGPAPPTEDGGDEACDGRGIAKLGTLVRTPAVGGPRRDYPAGAVPARGQAAPREPAGYGGRGGAVQ